MFDREKWQKQEQESLLAPTRTRFIEGTVLADEKKKTFDLLDAITRSGALSLHSVDLHVVIAATHCFDQV